MSIVLLPLRAALKYQAGDCHFNYHVIDFYHHHFNVLSFSCSLSVSLSPSGFKAILCYSEAENVIFLLGVNYVTTFNFVRDLDFKL